jgi:hypothetical protein
MRLPGRWIDASPTVDFYGLETICLVFGRAGKILLPTGLSALDDT